MTEPTKEPTITITQKAYDYLCEREDWLTALESAGVDNWTGFDYAQEIYNENQQDD